MGLFQHMPLQSRYYICLLCFLIEIEDSFEVSSKFGFVAGSSEQNVDMFPSNPFVQIIFGLRNIIRCIVKHIKDNLHLPL